MVFDEIESKLSDLKIKLEDILRQIEDNILSGYIDDKMKEVEDILKNLLPLVSSLIHEVNSGKISYDKASYIINLFSDIENFFLKIIEKLKNISEESSKRIEYLSNFEAQIKSAKAFALKGKNVKTKT